MPCVLKLFAFSGKKGGLLNIAEYSSFGLSVCLSSFHFLPPRMVLCLYFKKKETFCFITALLETFSGRSLVSHTGVRPMTGKLCPLMCVLLLGLKEKGKKAAGDKFVAPLTSCAFITRDCSGAHFLGAEMGFNQKIFKMQLKVVIIWGCFVPPCPTDEMQKQVWHLLSSFQQEQIFHAQIYSHVFCSWALW